MRTYRRKLSAFLAATVALLALTVSSAAFAASPPLAIGTGAGEVKRAKATISGIVLPQESAATVYYFEYSPEVCEAVAKRCGVKTSVVGPVTEFVEVSAKITRLEPGTTYHFWLVASSAAGTTDSAEEQFTTTVAEPEEYVFDKSFGAG
jgi:hypothetical protein